MEFKTGTLIEFRDRPWVVQQSTDPDILLIKPLGGTDAESTGLYLPLYGDSLEIKSYDFRKPSVEDVGENSFPGATKLLYDACRLSFRDIAGPFQCLGKLSFEPRPYQIVPLILALKQKQIRMLISDDVGIGKTLEALLIAKELLDRGEISRFAVICLPHLCEQWQNEIRDKFGLEAEIIRSSTISRLEKGLRANQNVFRDIPFQIISIDYIKSSDRKMMFLQHCPELVIVDEAHSSAKPKGANKSQQQRYSLLKDIADTERQIILLTATPHSGHMEEFQSLIGLLKPDFAGYTLDNADQRKTLSNFFIQRRRADVKPYVGDEVIFPTRQHVDDKYNLSKPYYDLLHEIIRYVKRGVKQAKVEGKLKQRYIYWDMLALIRGVMSSPSAGKSMLENKIAKRMSESEDSDEEVKNVYTFNNSLQDLLNGDDILPDSYETSTQSEKVSFRHFIAQLEKIMEEDKDEKIKKAYEIAEFMITSGKNPIIFCQYIQTAEYVKKYFDKRLALGKDKWMKDVTVGLITSRLADEERKIKIDELSKSLKHILICTDCLSEGVNLQNGFDAIIHYDLPWNPNRVEQRNGRIDRFGQTSPEVYISTMYDDVNNPVDKIVMKVLYRKQEQIRKDLGVYIPIADNDSSLMETIMEQIIVLDQADRYVYPSLFTEDDFAETTKEREERLLRAVDIEKKSHTYFAHNTAAMDPTRLKIALDQAKKIIGDTGDTRDFVVGQLQHMGVSLVEDKKHPMSFSFNILQLPSSLKQYFNKTADKKGLVKFSFLSPTPKGFMYIGRNSVLVEDLARAVVNDSVNKGKMAAGRAMVMETDMVDKPTTVLMMRVRSVISEAKNKERQIVGEEMIFFGYRGYIDRHDFLSEDEARTIFLQARASGNVDLPAQKIAFSKRLAWINDEKTLREHTDALALERANKLVEAFSKYRTYVAAKEYQVVRPILPMDVIAAYVFLPKLR